MARVVNDGDRHPYLPPQLQFLHRANANDIVDWLWGGGGGGGSENKKN
jgi:hypothetical protein